MSYWDDPAVEAAEAAYEAAKKAAQKAAAGAKWDAEHAKDVLTASHKLHEAVAAWYRKHPDRTPAKRHAFDEHTDI